MKGRGQFERVREYAEKSLALAKLHELAELRQQVETLLRELG